MKNKLTIEKLKNIGKLKNVEIKEFSYRGLVSIFYKNTMINFYTNKNGWYSHPLPYETNLINEDYEYNFQKIRNKILNILNERDNND